MAWSGAGDLRFDWDGALRVARRLWALGEQVDALNVGRFTQATDALVDWKGTYGTEFGTRMTTERSSAVAIANGLREGANGWAFQWKSAMDEQNRRLHAREEERAKEDRNLLEKGKDWLVGGDDPIPKPGEASVPVPPSFAATCSFVSY